MNQLNLNPFQGLEAQESAAKKQAQHRLGQAMSIGANSFASVVEIARKTVITDRLVDPVNTEMYITPALDVVLRYQFTGHSDVRVSPHALNQMCKVTEIPKPYVNALLSGCAGMGEKTRKLLLCHVFNTHLQQGTYLDRKKEPAKFLHRLVDGELRAFLSRSYNRKLGTVAMLRPFLEQCSVHQAAPAGAFSDRLRLTVRCFLPIIFEPVDGEFVAFGVSYTNSDFGAANCLVQGVLLRLSSGGTVILEDEFRKIHLGAVIKEEELELSAETLEKEAQTHMSAIRDLVNGVFSQQSIERNLAGVKLAIENKLRWDQLRARVANHLNKGEQASLEEMLKQTHEGVIDLPPVTLDSDGSPEANLWWASAALGIIANRMEDVERKIDIQELAGRLLNA